MNVKEMLRKATHTSKAIKIVYTVCIVAFIAAACIMSYRIDSEKPNAIDFTTNGAIGMETDKYVYLQVEGLTEMVATYGNDDNEKNDDNQKYYLAINNGYFYIVNLDTTGLEELQSIQDFTYSRIENKPAPKVIYGITEEADPKLKEAVVDYFNQIYPDANITVDQFEQYFGSVILNTRKDPVDVQIELLVMMFSAITFVVTIVVHILKVVTRRKTYKYLKKNGYENDLENQLDNIEEHAYNYKVIMTKDFLVDTTDGFVVIKFSDIKWIYTHKIRYYGFVTTSDIIVYLKDGKTSFRCGCVNGDINDEFELVFDKICQKSPSDVLKGYTSENMKEFKEYKRSLKHENL